MRIFTKIALPAVIGVGALSSGLWLYHEASLPDSSGRTTSKQAGRPAHMKAPPQHALSTQSEASVRNRGGAARKVPHPSVEASAQPISSWAHGYYSADSLFTYATRVAKAAIAGDGRAQYFLSRTLEYCDSRITPIKRSGLTVDEYLESTRLPYTTESMMQKNRREIERCRGFLHANPLAKLSLPRKAQTEKYWFAKAVQSKDPLALIDRAALAAGPTRANSAKKEKAVQKEVLDAAHAAIVSKEPAAISDVGRLFMSGRLARDPSFQGPAWLLAACELGYDCSANNPQLPYVSCDQTGACPTLQDSLQQSLSGGQYGRVYAASQDIAYKVKHGDWSGLQQYLRTKGLPDSGGQ